MKNKYVLFLIAIVLFVIIYTLKMSRKIAPLPTADLGLGDDPKLAGKSDSAATNTILAWFQARPRATSALQSAGLINVNPTNRFIPDPVALTNQLTSSVPSDQPIKIDV